MLLKLNTWKPESDGSFSNTYPPDEFIPTMGMIHGEWLGDLSYCYYYVNDGTFQYKALIATTLDLNMPHPRLVLGEDSFVIGLRVPVTNTIGQLINTLWLGVRSGILDMFSQNFPPESRFEFIIDNLADRFYHKYMELWKPSEELEQVVDQVKKTPLIYRNMAHCSSVANMELLPTINRFAEGRRGSCVIKQEYISYIADLDPMANIGIMGRMLAAYTVPGGLLTSLLQDSGIIPGSHVAVCDHIFPNDECVFMAHLGLDVIHDFEMAVDGELSNYDFVRLVYQIIRLPEEESLPYRLNLIESEFESIYAGRTYAGVANFSFIELAINSILSGLNWTPETIEFVKTISDIIIVTLDGVSSFAVDLKQESWTHIRDMIVL